MLHFFDLFSSENEFSFTLVGFVLELCNVFVTTISRKSHIRTLVIIFLKKKVFYLERSHVGNYLS